MASTHSPRGRGIPESDREKLPTTFRSRASASAIRDLVWIATIALVTFALSAHFQLNERLNAWSRPWESYQLDELPIVVLSVIAGLSWFGWRRLREAQAELQRRLALESDLEAALKENRQLMRKNVRLQEEERRNLARELHDEMGQAINAIKVEAVNAGRDVAVTPGVRASLERIVALVNPLHVLIRDRLRTLRPPGLDELGLAAAVEHCIEGWRTRLPGTGITLSFDGDFEHLGEEANITLYRLVQEGLTNAARHARASHIDVRFSRHPQGGVILKVIDDGVGLGVAVSGNGLGLRGMKERIAALGGSFSMESTSPSGLTLVSHIPVEGVPI